MEEHRPHKVQDELCFAIYSTQKAYNKFYYESLKPYKLTYLQFITLLVLWDAPKSGLIVKELGSQLGLDSGTLTPLLKRMENKGWVTRDNSAADGRKLVVQLTDKAWDLEDDIKDHVSDCFATSNLTETEYVKKVNQVKEICQRIEKN